MATNLISIDAAVNWRRYHAIVQEARATIRRAPRNDRPAMFHRYQRRILRECVRVGLHDRALEAVIL